MDWIIREDAILRDAELLHLSFDDACVYSRVQDSEVRERLEELLDYDPIFSDALDDICSNVVGRTLFRLLATKAITAGKEGRIGLANYDGSVSLYSRRDFSVFINRDLFDGNGESRDSSKYYRINEKGEIDLKAKFISFAIFHEFCHALHDIEKIAEMVEVGELHRSNGILAYSWDSAEELRTITGCIFGVRYDPICDHCFDLCHSVLHRRPFCPRYSHRGYDPETPQREEADERRRLAAYLSESRKIMEGWKRYVF